jgi:surface protein
MFYGCENLTELDLSNFDMTNVSAFNTLSMFGYCDKLHTLRLDNCSNDTISKIINSSGFPTQAISGVTRKIRCKQANATGLTPPENWVFEYVN